MSVGFYIGILITLLCIEGITVACLLRIESAFERIERLLREKKGDKG